MDGKIDVIAELKGMLEYIEQENIDQLQQATLKGAIELIEGKRKELGPTSHSEKTEDDAMSNLRLKRLMENGQRFIRHIIQ